MDNSSGTEQRPINLYEMTDRLGMERGWGALPLCGLTYATAVRQCRKCARPAECRAWLDASAGRRSFPPRWCSNIDLIVELLYDHPAFSCSNNAP
jgi:hypothetical protein